MSAANELRLRPPLPQGARPSSRGPLIAAVAGLGAVALCDLFSLFAAARLRGLIKGDDGFRFADRQGLLDAYDLYETAHRWQVGAYLPCAVAFVVWFFLMRRATAPLGPDRFRNGPGWAIGAWAVPVGNLWLPYQVAIDMWYAATRLPADDEPYRAVRTWPVTLWWSLFVCGILLDRFSATRYHRTENLAELRGAVGQYMIGDVLNVAAAVAAVYFAVQLTAMQRRKATEGRPAAA
ncbi:DUF4328 domain-containing protein [Streptomyces sp. NPDC049915]|uniref:DUF4328 domain-containing protein n=1 Tax=Streptomyces sp. NPDC049915 TaxID=3155510 RepID=UPI0034352890